MVPHDCKKVHLLQLHQCRDRKKMLYKFRDGRKGSCCNLKGSNTITNPKFTLKMLECPVALINNIYSLNKSAMGLVWFSIVIGPSSSVGLKPRCMWQTFIARDPKQVMYFLCHDMTTHIYWSKAQVPFLRDADDNVPWCESGQVCGFRSPNPSWKWHYVCTH